MCITAQSSSPSRNPNDCPGCSGSDLSDAMWWTALARLTLCDECRITVRGYIEEYQAVWDLAPGGVAWAEQIARDQFPDHPEFDDAEAPNQFPDHPDGDWEGDDTGD